MSLPELELDSQQFGLALDLVAGWQIERILGQKLWPEWKELESIGFIDEHEAEGINPFGQDNWKGVKFDGYLQEVYRYDTSIESITSEIDMRHDGYYILTWAWPRKYYGSTIFRQLSESSEYEQVDCRNGRVDCVRLPL